MFEKQYAQANIYLGITLFRRSDDGIYDEDFIEDRRKGLEIFVNK